MKTIRLRLLLSIASVLFIVACSKDKPDTTGFDQAAQLAQEVSESNVMSWVVQLANVRATDVTVNNKDFPPGDHFPTDHLTRDASVGVVAGALKAMGYAPDTLVLGEGPDAAYNVVAEWPGTTNPGEVILVGSHLDAFYAGADDNGSAVAAMLETARIVRNHSFGRTIRFVSFDLEELGSIGSTRYVEAGYANDVVAAIVLDLVGYSSSEPGSQKNVMGIKLPDVGDYLLVVGNDDSKDLTQKTVALGNSYGLSKSVGLLAPGDGTYFLSSAFMRSDHGLLWYKGIPAIFFTDGANFRNPNYHHATDLPETLNPGFLAGNTRLLTAIVAYLAGEKQ
jgi:hypothetical protein